MDRMDPQREEQLKNSAEALAYHVFGLFQSLKQATEGFKAGVRILEQTHGPLPVPNLTLTLPEHELPSKPRRAMESTKPRKVRAALHPESVATMQYADALVEGVLNEVARGLQRDAVPDSDPSPTPQKKEREKVSCEPNKAAEMQNGLKRRPLPAFAFEGSFLENYNELDITPESSGQNNERPTPEAKRRRVDDII